MGSSNSTSETSENNESDTVEKISEVVGRAIGAAIGDKVAGVPGTIVGEEVGKHVITPAIKYMGENGAYSYDTPNGTVVGNAYGSTLYYDDGTVADVELYLD